MTSVGPVSWVEAEDGRRNLTGVTGFEFGPFWLLVRAHPHLHWMTLAGGARVANTKQLPGSSATSVTPVSCPGCTTPRRLSLRPVPCSGAALPTAPTCFHTHRVAPVPLLLLLRRLRLLLPPCVPGQIPLVAQSTFGPDHLWPDFGPKKKPKKVTTFGPLQVSPLLAQTTFGPRTR